MKRSAICGFLITLLWVTSSATGQSAHINQQIQQNPSAPVRAKRTQIQIEDAVTRFMAANSLPSVSVAVVENGEYEWAAGFGLADLENFVPATSRTLYRLASVSKPITATATMVLYQRGKLDLDAPVQKYCPTFPKKESPITTRELLGHIAGIRHYRSESLDDPEIVNIKHFDDPITGGLSFFKDDPLVSKPGAKFSYSTHGYTLVGCVIEGASGQKYVDFVRENVLEPSGMTATRVDDRFAVIPYRTRFYSKDKSGAVMNAPPVDVSFKVPGDGWLSSVEDMAKFEVAMLNDRLMARPTRNLMWTEQKTSDGKETPYGLGWGIGTALGVPTVEHGGGEYGTSTYIIIAPEQRAGVAVLINLNGGNASDLAPELMKIILGSASPNSK